MLFFCEKVVGERALCIILRRALWKKFSPAFFKRRHESSAVWRWSPPAGGEISYTAFLFDNFLFAPVVSKKKWTTSLAYFHGYHVGRGRPYRQKVTFARGSLLFIVS